MSEKAVDEVNLLYIVKSKALKRYRQSYEVIKFRNIASDHKVSCQCQNGLLSI